MPTEVDVVVQHKTKLQHSAEAGDKLCLLLNNLERKVERQMGVRADTHKVTKYESSDTSQPVEVQFQGNTSISVGNKKLVVEMEAVDEDDNEFRMDMLQTYLESLELLAVDYVKNTAAQVSLLAVGQQKLRKTTCDWWQKSLQNPSFTVRLGTFLKAVNDYADTTALAQEADGIIESRNGYVHHANMASLDEAVKTARRHLQNLPKLHKLCKKECKVINNYEAFRDVLFPFWASNNGV